MPDCKIGGTNSSGPQELSVSGTFFLQTEGLAGSSSSPFFPLPSPTLPWLLRPEQPRLASVDTVGGVAQCPLVNPGTVAFCPEQTIFTTALAAWRFLRVILSPGWSSCSYCCRDSDLQLRFLAVTLFSPPPELGSLAQLLGVSQPPKISFVLLPFFVVDQIEMFVSPKPW